MSAMPAPFGAAADVLGRLLAAVPAAQRRQALEHLLRCAAVQMKCAEQADRLPAA